MTQLMEVQTSSPTAPFTPARETAPLDNLMETAYQELRWIAHRRMQGERAGHTLQTTALVNEAYIRLRELRQIDWQDRAHFYAVAAGVMRRILVDRARARRAGKRFGDALRVTLDDHIPGEDDGLDLLALDDALQRLAEQDDVATQIVELRYFAGLSVADAAVVIGLSPASVKRKWALAQAWLFRELRAVG